MHYCEHEVGPSCNRRAVVVLHSPIDGDEKFCRPCAEGFAGRCKDNHIYAGDAAAIRRWLTENKEDNERDSPFARS